MELPEIPFTPDDDYQKPFDVLADLITPRPIPPPWEPNDHYQKPPEVLAKHIEPEPVSEWDRTYNYFKKRFGW